MFPLEIIFKGNRRGKDVPKKIVIFAFINEDIVLEINIEVFHKDIKLAFKKKKKYHIPYLLQKL